MVILSRAIYGALLYYTRQSFRSSRCLAMTSGMQPEKALLRTWRKIDPVEVARAYVPAEYQCIWWGHNPHIHTIFGSGEVSKRLFKKEGPDIVYRRERWDTPDNDFVDIDFYENDDVKLNGSNKIAVLTHGLESSSDAPLTANIAKAFAKNGYTVAVMCFRSCSGSDNRTLKAYHMGFTDDLGFVVEKLSEMHPSSFIFLSGFSLGGNVICKYLGELGDSAAKLGILGAAVACVPFDAIGCQKQIDSGFNRRVYSGNFLKTLIPKINRKYNDPELAEEASKILDIEAINECKTIGEFDDLYIAKVFGFESNIDYYLKNQSGPFLSKITVPVLAIQALDDPFMPADTLPTPESCGNAPIKLAYYERGGHCAFVSRNQADRENGGWLPTQLAAFAQYLEANHEI